jgi:2,4-dienoyl-CoA reductase-like NADH-dependent reductase (Old Yellow Enzyme family)
MEDSFCMNKVEQEINLQHIRCKNRLIRSAVHSFLGNPDGTMTAAEFNMYETLAKNDVGMIITGHCHVSPLGQANEEQIAIYDDQYIKQFGEAAAKVHPYGTKFVVQISHAGPRAIHNEDLADVVEREMKKNHHARELTLAEIGAIRQQFIDAARRLQKAGVDGIQIHAAHSYLLSRFIDVTFNQRTDEYGGSIENRFRLCAEIIEGIKAACGEDFPVFVKINNDSKTENEAYGQDMVYMLKQCRQLGVELVECSGVDFISMERTATLYYLERVAALRKEVDIPMSLVGGVRSLADMEAVLAAGIDMVSLGRPLICEPDIFKKLLSGEQEKSQCMSCNRCFALPHIKPGLRCVFQRKLKKKKED